MKSLEDRLKSDYISYPCFIVAYGPENRYRTRFRAEHGGEYADGMATCVSDAINIINRCLKSYCGPQNNVDIKAICISDGEISEVQV